MAWDMEAYRELKEKVKQQYMWNKWVERRISELEQEIDKLKKGIIVLIILSIIFILLR